MNGYHKYVFEDGKQVFKFDEMYAAEDAEGFDAWRQHDLRPLRLRLVREVLSDWNFDRVLDIGCGKGMQTQFLKRQNNYVLGMDISSAAVRKAKMSFPDIEFSDGGVFAGDPFDLISVQGSMAYMKTWRENLDFWHLHCRHCIVAEYIPANPIGEVKSIAELVTEFERWYAVNTKIVINDEIVILFGKTK